MKMKQKTNFELVRGWMCADNSLDSWIYETEAALKRDLTIKEENQYIQKTLDECKQIMEDCSMTLYEAYKALMY